MNETVAKEIQALPEDMQARFVRITRMIVDFGLERVGAPHVKHLEGQLWEIRLSGRGGIARALIRFGDAKTNCGRARLPEEDASYTSPRD